MLDNLIKCFTLAIIMRVAYVIAVGDRPSMNQSKFEASSIAGDFDVMTIEAEKPEVASKPEAILPNVSLLPLESYKPSVKSDDTKDKLAALDERVTQLESKFKSFSTAKAGSGSTGGGSTGSGSVGGGSTGNVAKVTYSSVAVPYQTSIVQVPRSSVVTYQCDNVVCRPVTSQTTRTTYRRFVK